MPFPRENFDHPAQAGLKVRSCHGTCVHKEFFKRGSSTGNFLMVVFFRMIQKINEKSVFFEILADRPLSEMKKEEESSSESHRASHQGQRSRSHVSSI